MNVHAKLKRLVEIMEEATRLKQALQDPLSGVTPTMVVRWASNAKRELAVIRQEFADITPSDERSHTLVPGLNAKWTQILLNEIVEKLKTQPRFGK